MMNKSRVSQTIPKRMAKAKSRGLTYRQYMGQAHLKRRQKGMVPPPRPKRPRDYWKYGHTKRQPTQVNVQTREGMPHTLFVKGSSMVGSHGPKQLVRFQPTREMLVDGFKPMSLRFFPRRKARLMGLQTRQEWIDDMIQKLKSRGLF